MSWPISIKNSFKKQYKRMGVTRQDRVNTALNELANSQDPTKLGTYKKSMQVYSYELGNHDRIIYSFDPKDGIELIRVCDHKSAYMKD
ncbi:MAG: hypothetical protein OEL81_06555 [Nitrosopumilus sp.]|nr:hypothetical protein [Nitrosopumilus sp.]